MAVITVLTVALMMSWVVPALADDLAKVNINSANLKELERLDGVGPAYAKRIIAYREKHGPFQKPEDLVRVRGVGQEILENNLDRILIKDK